MNTALTTEIARSTPVSPPVGSELVRTAPATPWMLRIEEHREWETLSEMKMTMRAEVLLHRFRVKDVLSLAVGQIFETLSPDTEDVPIRVGNVQLGWGEFEVVDQRMALRVTRLG